VFIIKLGAVGKKKTIYTTHFQYLIQYFLLVVSFSVHENCLDDVASILVLGKPEHGFILGQCLEDGHLVVLFATTCKNLLDDIIACGQFSE
jgi:hypothetical protein